MQVIINMTFDVVMATSAVSDMTEGFGCYSRDIVIPGKVKYFEEYCKHLNAVNSAVNSAFNRQ